jgi:hypothetical protein
MLSAALCYGFIYIYRYSWSVPCHAKYSIVPNAGIIAQVFIASLLSLCMLPPPEYWTAVQNMLYKALWNSTEERSLCVLCVSQRIC